MIKDNKQKIEDLVSRTLNFEAVGTPELRAQAGLGILKVLVGLRTSNLTTAEKLGFIRGLKTSFEKRNKEEEVEIVFFKEIMNYLNEQIVNISTRSEKEFLETPVSETEFLETRSSEVLLLENPILGPVISGMALALIKLALQSETNAVVTEEEKLKMIEKLNQRLQRRKEAGPSPLNPDLVPKSMNSSRVKFLVLLLLSNQFPNH